MMKNDNNKFIYWACLVILLLFSFTQCQRSKRCETKLRESERSLSLVNATLADVKNKLDIYENNISNPEYIFQLYSDYSIKNLEKTGFTGNIILKDPVNKIRVRGLMDKGKQRGNWSYTDLNGNTKKYRWNLYRVGAVCCNGKRSYSTGQGTCSWNGGVCEWLYDWYKDELN